MTLLCMYGFDETANERGTPLNGAGAIGTGRTATGRAAATTGSVGTSAYFGFLGLASSSFVCGVGYKAASAAAGDYFMIYEDATQHLRISLDATNHVLIKTSSGTVLATSTLTWSPTLWGYVEIKATIADGTGGSCEMRVDGVTLVSVTGVDTRNGGTGVPTQLVTTNPTGSTVVNIDDAYVCDLAGSAPYNDFLGDVKVETLFPNNNGDSSGWLGSDGNSVDNYLLVDESPVNTTDYVAASAAGVRDLYQMTDLATSVATVLGVMPVIYSAKNDAGTSPLVKPVVKVPSGTVRVQAAAPPLSTTYSSVYGEVDTVDPDAAAWSVTKVNGMQIGQESA